MFKSSKEECTICFSTLKNKTKRFKCNHYFHQDCIDNWITMNPSCPICRETELHEFKPIIKNHKYSYKLSGWAIYYDLNLNKYSTQWDKNKCKKNIKIHDIRFEKPYGVVGYCSCGSVQGFNV